jgi:hypothetical protein
MFSHWLWENVLFLKDQPMLLHTGAVEHGEVVESWKAGGWETDMAHHRIQISREVKRPDKQNDRFGLFCTSASDHCPLSSD